MAASKPPTGSEHRPASSRLTHLWDHLAVELLPACLAWAKLVREPQVLPVPQGLAVAKPKVSFQVEAVLARLAALLAVRAAVLRLPCSALLAV